MGDAICEVNNAQLGQNVYEYLGIKEKGCSASHNLELHITLSRSAQGYAQIAPILVKRNGR